MTKAEAQTIAAQLVAWWQANCEFNPTYEHLSEPAARERDIAKLEGAITGALLDAAEKATLEQDDFHGEGRGWDRTIA